MRYQILGPLRAYVDDREVAITAPRERVALATLLLHAGETVPVAHFVDAIWSDAPPESARNQVQACVSRLRRRLTGAVVMTAPDGYRLQVDRRQVDLHEFRALVVAARAAGSPDRARDLYRTALGLWCGPAFAGLDSSELRGIAEALEQERIQALEECLEVELRLGEAGTLVAELTGLVRAHPYRERVRAALMRALYRSGRPAEALEEYQRLRRLLHDELGTEPGEELQRLHKAILNRDPSLDPPATSPADPAPAMRELPAEPSRFVGRDQETAEVRAALVPADRDVRRRPTVVVVYGPGGVGKSALAVRVAHDLVADFPDGQLYVDLCGSTPGMRPLTAVEVLGRFLRRLGVPPEQIPTEQAEAAALFRSATTDRRLLLVLDNTASTDQVAPLLPASPTCGVLVTSRYPLATLDVDHRLRLGVLADTDGLTLLTSLTGRLALEPEAAQSILALSGGLPLAIRIAAGRLACRPDISVSEYAQRLADRSRRLDELQLEDLAVRASIRTSYDALLSSGDPAAGLAARAFRVLGLLHVPDVTPEVVAAMLAKPDVEVARVALDRLVDAQLLDAFRDGRYRLHDLVRLLATERAIEEDSALKRAEAVSGALAFYIGALSLADARIQRARALPFGVPTTGGGVCLPTLRSPVQARAWIDAELLSLVSVFEQAISTTDTPSEPVIWFGEMLWNALDSRCEWQIAYQVSLRILKAADERGDRRVAACGYLLHGRSEACLGRYEAALANLETALRVLQDLDNPVGVALALNGLGLTHGRCRDFSASLSRYAEALSVTRRSGLADLTAVVLNNMAVSYTRVGELDRALACAEEGSSICIALDDIHTLGSVSNNTAALRCLAGEYAMAIQSADKAAELSVQVGHRPTECEALVIRSETNHRWGHLAEAVADAEKAVATAQNGGYLYAAAAAQWQRAKILATMGRSDEARQARLLADEAYAGLADAFLDPMTEFVVGREAVPGVRGTASRMVGPVAA